jgi:hypothetical protein
VQALKVPAVLSAREGITPAEQALYDGFTGLDFNTPFPWGEGPRRMGADKRGDVVWVNDFFGGSIFKIDTKTLKTSLIPVPDAANQYPYHATVDQHHNVWINMMNSDQVLRYEPKTGQFTSFDLPTLGTETRYVSLLERDGKMEVVLPYFRSLKIGVMTFRSDKDIAAIKKESQTN